MPPVKVVVLGTGSAGMRHLRTFGALPGVEVTAVPVRPERVLDLRSQGFRAEAELAVALGNAAGAVVATDTRRHVDDALAAASRCAVLVEKPLSIDAPSAGRLVDTKWPISVGCVLRFDAGLQWVQERIAALGRLHTVDAECLSWLPDWRPTRDFRESYSSRPGEGGVVLDLIHEIDYCCWLFGAPRRVLARLENRGVLGLPEGTDESAWLLLDTAAVTVNLRLSYAVRPSSRRLRIFGEHGQLTWDGVNRVATHVDGRGAQLQEHTWPGPDAMYQAQAREWVESLSGAQPTVLARARDGVTALEVCDAARASSAAGSWVSVR